MIKITLSIETSHLQGRKASLIFISQLEDALAMKKEETQPARIMEIGLADF